MTPQSTTDRPTAAGPGHPMPSDTVVVDGVDHAVLASAVYNDEDPDRGEVWVVLVARRQAPCFRVVHTDRAGRVLYDLPSPEPLFNIHPAVAWFDQCGGD